MKKLLFLGLTIVLFTACEKQQTRYTQQSPEIDTYKKVIADYENRDWESLASHYADTAKILNNVTMKDAKTIEQEITMGKEDAGLFASWKYQPESVEYEMVITDKGQTWVNFWGIWEATLLANNKTYVIPAHITAQFVDGKIVREDGYWDLSEIMTDMQEMQYSEQSVPGETAVPEE
ncbi:nuclear transport factor 2 family protein [Aequorivita lipolytica]|uniref:Nuclear transport factor 2 family protein n=1 Tax=Aequorivita lipolytica TaxID=153267 RepID=A0A5C6YSE5_9FLAO|nr:nuclear transport factor 2 family protein [Aequorivita lipolytica]TXD69834.1 nuclear transport factor 2 family protein [Aequorivita lipolytica]SRX50354.1 hypothetical protein AEQU2_00826 [Aequorivita lipolytica]